MSKKVIFVHGRDVKPEKADLEELWFEAVRKGLERDKGEDGVALFKSIDKEFVYYGDLSNKFLKEEKKREVPADAVASRKQTLKDLSDYAEEDFNKRTYNEVIEKNVLYEALADTFSGALSLLRAGTPLVSAVAPDMAHYWNQENYFGSDVRYRLTTALERAFDTYDDILLVSHSLGTIVSYDTLWKFTHYSEYRHKYPKGKKLDFITMGSPLGDENVKQHLKGKDSKGTFKYPHNIRTWTNISAEDDFISHDSKIKNDYKEMIKLGLIAKENFTDIHPIYNLSVRNGKSNAHSSLGYLIHPAFIDVLYQWMEK